MPRGSDVPIGPAEGTRSFPQTGSFPRLAIMKYILLTATLALLSISALGCCCNTCHFGDGVVYDRQERKARHKAIIDNDCKQFTDDWDYFWLMDEKTRLSEWKVE